MVCAQIQYSVMQNIFIDACKGGSDSSELQQKGRAHITRFAKKVTWKVAKKVAK